MMTIIYPFTTSQLMIVSFSIDHHFILSYIIMIIDLSTRLPLYINILIASNHQEDDNNEKRVCSMLGYHLTQNNALKC